MRHLAQVLDPVDEMRLHELVEVFAFLCFLQLARDLERQTRGHRYGDRAMRTFVRGRANTAFWKTACKFEVRAIEHVMELFLTHRKEIRHPDPRTAIAMAFMMVVSTLFEIVVMPTDLGPLKSFLPKDDQALKRELTRAFLSYLGVENIPVWEHGDE